MNFIMKKNTISALAYVVNGATSDILESVTPAAAIENYFLPDMRPPVQTLVIKAVTDEGKTVLLSITQNSVHVKMD